MPRVKSVRFHMADACATSLLAARGSRGEGIIARAGGGGIYASGSVASVSKNMSLCSYTIFIPFNASSHKHLHTLYTVSCT